MKRRLCFSVVFKNCIHVKVLGIYYSLSFKIFLVNCIVQNTSLLAWIVSCLLEILLFIHHLIWFRHFCILLYASPLVQKYISVVKSPPNHTSPPSTAATFFATHLMAVLQSSRYSIFHSGDTPIQLSLLWQSYSCQHLNTETSTWGNRGFTTETPSIF